MLSLFLVPLVPATPSSLWQMVRASYFDNLIVQRLFFIIETPSGVVYRLEARVRGFRGGAKKAGFFTPPTQ